ncbi:hypothetical protein EVJ58_g1471 [Rhodofomes roseus]|uniref:N-acetyltransferase domain-containing protein n=1 Tax=Rhodofomes roseus TaxID=34475 RepID=A0A4Y9Z1E8_9APHY|nr:hypothetical protein EVJ58_g1471 [Rhodofomes roseus]
MIIDPESDIAASVTLERPTIREATPDDVPELARLFLASVDTSLPGVKFSHLPGYDLPSIESHLQNRLFPPPAVQTVCLEAAGSREILGYASVKSKHSEEDETEPELDMFFVKVGRSGRVYGGMLMQGVRERWRETGVRVKVFTRNERAINFYRKWGFVTTDAEELEFGEGTGRQKELVYVMRWRVA